MIRNPGSAIPTKALGVILLVFAMAASAAAQTTYTWNGSVSTDYQVADNWTPTRSVPATNDILVISGGTYTLTNVKAETIGKLQITSGASATLSSAAAVTLNVAAAAGAFVVDAGTRLTFTGSFPITIGGLTVASAGQIYGDLIFTAQASTSSKLQVGAAGAVVFYSGSSCALVPQLTAAGSSFGGTSGGVVFSSGATFHQCALPDGTRLTTPAYGGANPFPVIQMNSGSNYVAWDKDGVSMAGRTFGNFIWRGTASLGVSVTDGRVTTIQNDLKTLPSGGATQAPIIFTLTGAADGVSQLIVGGNVVLTAGSGGMTDGGNPAAGTVINYEYRGDIDVQNAALYNANTNITRGTLLAGSATQNVNFAGKTLTNLIVRNSAGVNLTGAVTVSNQLNLQSGAVANGANLFKAPDGANGVVYTSGYVSGTLTRTINAANTGLRTFPVGTGSSSTGVDVNITSPGTGTGTIAVSSTASVHPNTINPASSVTRYWTVTGSGVDLSAGQASLVLHYLASDVPGGVTESAMIAARYAGTWTKFPNPGGTTVDTGTHTATVAGVTGFSDWALGAADFVPVGFSRISVE